MQCNWLRVLTLGVLVTSLALRTARMERMERMERMALTASVRSTPPRSPTTFSKASRS